MAELSEESQRITNQVTSLSTQLIESIDRQSLLEDKLNQANRTIQSQKLESDRYESLEKEHESLKIEVSKKNETEKDLRQKLKTQEELRTQADLEVSKLSQEVEDLTASLFAEANNMVADARREKHTTEILNTKLIEQLKEKDNLIETLSLQLKNLKKVIQNVEADSVSNQSNRYSTILNDSNTTSGRSLNRTNTSTSSISMEQENVIIYSPNVTTIRYDLTLFNEFLKFIAVLPYCKNIRESSSESKLLRRIINDEIQPILRIDNAAGIGWLAKKSLLQQMMDGLVILEPLSGINETYQIGYRNTNDTTIQSNESDGTKEPHMFNYPANSPPVAVHGPCALCGEDRDDVIEHARMHVFKTQTKADDGTLSVNNTYPLCYSCVNKVRQTCQIFAFLRSLKLGTWHLEKVTLKTIEKGNWNKLDNVNKVGRPINPLDKKSKRKSFISGLGMPPMKSSPQIETPNAVVERAGFPTTNIQRAWLHLCKLRCMLFWSHVGVWSIDAAITSNIGPKILSKDEFPVAQSSEDLPNWVASLSKESLTSQQDVKEEETFDFESKSTLGEEIENEKSNDKAPVEVEEHSEQEAKDETLTEKSNDETFIKEDNSQLVESANENENTEETKLKSHLDDRAPSDVVSNKEDDIKSVEDASDNLEHIEKHNTPEQTTKIEMNSDSPESINDEDSIAILDGYSEQRNGKERSASGSNDEDEWFDDAQENLG